MKHTKKKRLLAIVLCMILVLSTGIAAFANENVGLQSVACQAATLERVIKNAEGEDVGTLIADIPEGTFLASSSDANIQMDVQADPGADGVLDRVQQQLEANGETGYTLNNYVMADVTFYVNGEKQVPQQPITFHVSGTSIDTENVMAFADDRQNTTTLMDADTDENGALQFTAQTFGTETVVCGIFDVTEAEEEDENTEEKFAADPVTTGAKVEDETTTQKNDNVQAVANVEKTVSITENYGKLTANYSDTTADVGYVWYRSVNGATTAERQIPTQYSSTTGTNLGKDISSDGKELYIALNGGALGYNGNKSVTYTVEAYSKNDLNEYGLPNDDATALATSSVYNVTGYYEVQNGSFETPSVAKYHQNTNNWQFSNENYKRLDGVWQTTGTHDADTRWSDSEGADIEIVTTTSGTSLKRQNDRDQRYNWHGDEIAADGNQFAELNCAAAGALYQDVLTTPGEVLNYQVAHRARGSNGNDSSAVENDTMYVVAMSSDLAKNITTQAQVLDVVNNKEKYPGVV